MKALSSVKAVCGTSVVALFLAACSQTAPDTREADIKALNDNETRWNQDFQSKDAAKLVAQYADDAVLMAPGMPASKGREAIRKALTEMVADPALSLKFQPSRVEVAKSGDFGYTQGTYTMTMTDPSSKKIIKDHGSYVTTYRKQPDGSWKAAADISTSEVPPATQHPAPAKAKKRRR